MSAKRQASAKRLRTTKSGGSKSSKPSAPSKKPTRPTPTIEGWPADSVERRPIASLVPYANNPRLHSPEQVAQLEASIREFGWTIPILLDEDGGIIAGHGRVMAAKGLGFTEAPCMVARGWSDAKKRAYVIADNKLTLNSSWDDDLLKSELAFLKESDFDLNVIGFSNEEVEIIFESEVEGPTEEDKNRGRLLSRMQITIADPRHEVGRGDRFVLSGRHHLLIAGVMADWRQWKDLLVEGAIFCPYPGPFVPFGAMAGTHALIMVQPDCYIAGHILDRYEDAYGHASIVSIKKAK